jgi:hypothetical protein
MIKTLASATAAHGRDHTQTIDASHHLAFLLKV